MHARALATAVAAVALLPSTAWLASGADAAPRAATVPFKDARLKIEYNATDGDAGLQVFVDADPWREIRITNPAGRVVAEVEAEDVIRDYGLTELFSESSEPPFDEFPFEEFKRLFPEGRYTFTGQMIDGTRMRSTFNFRHTVPDGPQILAPAPDAALAQDALVVEWAPDASPGAVDVVAYQVLVVDDEPSLGNPKRVLDVMLPASATRFPVPLEFLVPGTYKTEVLAIDRTGNQTLSEVPFTIQ